MVQLPKITKQQQFFRRCVTGTETLEEILKDLDISPYMFVRWLGERDFKSRMHGMRRYLQRARDLQLEASSVRAAEMLSRIAVGTEMKPVARAACIDVIRLARDSRVRRRNAKPDEVLRHRKLAHPDISDEEATRLMLELETSHVNAADRSAPSLALLPNVVPPA